MDASGTALLECRFYGCLVPHLYNTVRPHSSLGYKPPAPEARLISTGKGHGEVETATRFPLLHTPDGDYLNSKINALH
jgi:putative transposase